MVRTISRLLNNTARDNRSLDESGSIIEVDENSFRFIWGVCEQICECLEIA